MSDTTPGAPRADGVLASPAFAELFAALSDARLAQLETPRRVITNLYTATVLTFLAVLFYFGARYAADSLSAVTSAVACAGCAIVAARLFLRAAVQVKILRTRGARRRARREACGRWDDQIQQAYELGELSRKLSLRALDELVGFAIELLLEAFLTPLLRRQKSRWLPHVRAAAQPLIEPGEQVLVIAGPPSAMNRRGSASLLNLNRKTAFVLLTDRRIVCHVMRSKRRLGKKLMEAPLSALRVREWYPSTLPADPPGGSWVLWLADGSGTMRFSFVRSWREEALLLFNTLYAAQLAREGAGTAAR